MLFFSNSCQNEAAIKKTNAVLHGANPAASYISQEAARRESQKHQAIAIPAIPCGAASHFFLKKKILRFVNVSDAPEEPDLLGLLLPHLYARADASL